MLIQVMTNDIEADGICSTDEKRLAAQAKGLGVASVYGCTKIANMTMTSLLPLLYRLTSMILLVCGPFLNLS